MKILHVCGDSAYGGGSGIITRLALAAREAGHSVAILATDPVFIDRLQQLDLTVVDLECIWRPIRPFRDLRGLRRLSRLLDESSYDLVHTHTTKAGVVGRRAAWTAQIPLVVHTVHGFAFHERSAAPYVRAVAAVERLAARWCHKLVTVSEFHRDWAIALEIASADKIVAIPNGIPFASPVPPQEVIAIRRSFGVPDGATMIVSAGRLAPGKGLAELVAAVAILSRSPEYAPYLVLPGTGELSGKLRYLAQRAGVGERVILPGFLEKIRTVVGASDLVVLPSEREGLSLALLEAMSAARPIVASEIGSNREATADGRAAMLVPTRAPAALAAAIGTLMKDKPKRERLATVAAEIFLERYDEQRMLDRYLSLYGELAASRAVSGKAPSA